MIIPLKDDAEYPRLVFVYDVHEYDMAPYGYRGDVVVEFANGDSFPIYFYEAAGVQEELEDRKKSGFGSFVSEPGLVIIPKITLESMKTVVAILVEIGHFEHLVPISKTEGNADTDNHC